MSLRGLFSTNQRLSLIIIIKTSLAPIHDEIPVAINCE